MFDEQDMLKINRITYMNSHRLKIQNVSDLSNNPNFVHPNLEKFSAAADI